MRWSGWPERGQQDFFEIWDSGVQSFRHKARHPDRIYTVAANFEAYPEHAGKFATGPWPWRGVPARPAPSHALRVGVFGDSCIYGHDVFVAETLAERLRGELIALGSCPEQLLVSNYGVSGYSTVQIRLALAEVLEQESLDAVVVYPAAWNDQFFANGARDVEIFSQGQGLRLEDWLPATEAWLSRSTGSSEARESHAVLLEEWMQGRPRYGVRVNPDELEQELVRIIQIARDHGSALLFAAPAHREDCLADFPRTGADAQSVLDVARREGLSTVDCAATLRASGKEEDELFLDVVHPSPVALELLAKALAPPLAKLLEAPAARLGNAVSTSLRIVSISPREACLLGDVVVEVELDGWDEDRLPTVCVGGQPLLDLARAGPRRVRGRLAANGEGPCDLLVLTDSAMALAEDALELWRPWIEALSATPPRVRIHARTGDRVDLFFARNVRSAPDWEPQGPLWLARPYLSRIETGNVCGADGSVEVELPWLAESGLPELWSQARVMPRGIDDQRYLVLSKPARIAVH